MVLETPDYYTALRTHDRRFDGLFYVGVSSTGIYCRPVCPARTPKESNCTFFRSAAEAERSGYRPCLRCRPELAPGNARVDSVKRLAALAVSRIEDGLLSELHVEDLAADLGVSDRHLRRAVEQEFGVSPIEYAQTCRLLTAKRLLTDTNLPVIQVAFASGFASLRRFNALFKEQYGMPPTALRKEARPRAVPNTLKCEIAYKPPYAWPVMLEFLRRRALPGVEEVEGHTYRRTYAANGASGWVSVTFEKTRPAVHVEFSAELAPAIVTIIANTKRLLDLNADSRQIDRDLGDLAAAFPGIRLPGTFDGFEIALRAIVGQQVTVAAARTVLSRMVQRFGRPLATSHGSLTLLTPRAEEIATASIGDICKCGMPEKRARTIISVAERVASGALDLNAVAARAQAMELLKEIPGIGPWTCGCIAMRALSWPDAFLEGDYGVKKGMGMEKPSEILKAAESWRPWRAYAVMRLWHGLEKTK